MTPVDRLIQSWRMSKAHAWVGENDTVLDIGTADGVLFHRWGVDGVGLDPDAVEAGSTPARRLVRGAFPDALPEDIAPMDAVLALAVLEHLGEAELQTWEKAIHDVLKPGGRFISTVPQPTVDRILHVLIRLRIVDGMHAHEHHGFRVATVPETFTTPRWRLVHHRRFQAGLNNLFVFERN